ncbi:hypothetical protein TCELL_0835 [Thermogladius calderae 1633]|uniref:Uncharacterized protein n=1 Tax=Thermogladius calderae (strain DSM 22663 / VKM B-2946 / 1633) TaxID=1184251 RepID=I3TES1_THEC1|nr:hypothetical protein [Thermogladius calderae]AFK51259.1 hypothetical protein TCELL_0835 [Thermogladius calderae 1633]
MTSRVLEETLRLVEGIGRELRRLGVNYVVLDDLATGLYGLVQPLQEARVLVDAGREDDVIQAVTSATQMGYIQAKLRTSLREKGVAAVNLVTLPLLVIETAVTGLDVELLRESFAYNLLGFEVRLPPLEGLIAKLVARGQYPYTAKGLALMMAWADSLSRDRLKKSLEKSGADPAVLKALLAEAWKLASGLTPLRLKESAVHDLLENL